MITQEPHVQTFYETDRINEAEAQRLQLMATYADFVSLAAIHEITDRQDVVCVDVGAGDSITLGQKIYERNETAKYIPIDLREDAVSRHRDAGFDARVGYATDLPLPDNTADVLHSRFTFGWLDHAGRARALEEMIRVGNNHAQLTVIDYDWGRAGGPEPVNRLVDKVTGIMGAFGFDPYYGAKSAEEMQAGLAEYGYTSENAEITTHRTGIKESMSRSLPTIEATVQPVVSKLTEFGLTEDAEGVAKLLEEVRAYAMDHPDEEMQFPDIVAVTAKVQSETLHEEALAKIHHIRSVGREAMSQETMVAVGSPLLNTYVLPSASTRLQARQLHARAFYDHGYVTDEGLNPDGTLIEEIDPQEIIDASTYIGVINGEATVTGNIRVVELDDGRPHRLPTVVKVTEALGEDNELLKDLPFMRAGMKVNEASALGRSGQSKDKTIMPKLLLAAWSEAKRRGTDYMVMTIVNGTARMLTAGFGEEAFQRIDGDAAVVQLKGKGINPQGVTLVPFYVHIDTFVESCLKHFDKNPDSEFVKQARPLFEAASEFVRTAA